MRASHAVLICLIILAIFSYTAATISPLIQQDIDFIPNEKTTLCKSLKVSQKGKPGLIILGDPIDDPLPHDH